MATMCKCPKCKHYTTSEKNIPCDFCTDKVVIIETGNTPKGGPYQIGKLK